MTPNQTSSPPVEDRMRQFMRLMGRFQRTARRGMQLALSDCPRCHMGMLEQLHAAIERHGRDGAVYVSDVAVSTRNSPQAVSRALRILEKDGLAERMPDPDDRRKTLVRLTEAGDAARLQAEYALKGYLSDALAALPAETTERMLRDWTALLDAMDRRNDLLESQRKENDA
ncbi:MAG: winged helix DNA-binding protein [Gemmiger sp.]|uniref:MarR family winged helix-turn-helix transcriptional regulator n=1 Tax=Gemmiger sp. TaxID=2049027 RepID=UPI002E791617|nr:MarR family transcriptional regulator [Gemmiger sp.]MEE0800687.1 winged helix DNA-binding protein [Gemmiger sp.]